MLRGRLVGVSVFPILLMTGLTACDGSSQNVKAPYESPSENTTYLFTRQDGNGTQTDWATTIAGVDYTRLLTRNAASASSSAEVWRRIKRDGVIEVVGGEVQPATRDRACVDYKTARDRNGHEVECIPYRCEGGACLTRCHTVKDCAGEGWPMNCVNTRCVPQPPRDRQRPR